MEDQEKKRKEIEAQLMSLRMEKDMFSMKRAQMQQRIVEIQSQINNIDPNNQQQHLLELSYAQKELEMVNSQFMNMELELSHQIDKAISELEKIQ